MKITLARRTSFTSSDLLRDGLRRPRPGLFKYMGCTEPERRKYLFVMPILSAVSLAEGRKTPGVTPPFDWAPKCIVDKHCMPDYIHKISK